MTSVIDAMAPKLESIEISTQGKWRSTPALAIAGKHLIIVGKWLKKAIVHDEEWLPTTIDDPESWCALIREQRKSGFAADLFVFTQKIPEVTPKFSYPMEMVSIAAIRIDSFDNWWRKLPQESRKNVRRAQRRGVSVEVRSFSDDLIASIVGVNNDSPYRQNKAFTHFGKTFEEVKKDHSSFVDRCDFVCAYADGDLIGFLKLVYRGDIASILQLLPKLSESDKRPANAMLAKAVEICAQRGVSHITYGMYNYGNKGHSSLREFKERNGFEEILTPRYFVPLTLKGRLCIRANLHQGLRGLLPAQVLTMLSAVRKNLLAAKSFIGRCSSRAERPNRNRKMECANPSTGSNTIPRMPIDG